ncbi:hypothetical protein PybrP1_010699 [[Pythium] brassicae (nom. inval.)]|nr:hypothetical protein PybrP1_010699 [[Pythium] brassicae (nom. inval.)]
MLSGIFHKRKKIQELRSPALQDIKKAEARGNPSVLGEGASVYKAISCQKELHSVDFRQEDITDPQLVALAETLMEMPMISFLDLRDNRITDDGAKALLEVLRLQIIAAKSPLKLDPRTKLPVIPIVPEYTRYVTQVNLKGNEISASVLQELVQYTELLKREDKRVEIRAALAQIDRNTAGGIDEDEFKAVLKLLTGAEPSRKEVKMLMQQHTQSSDSLQKSAVNLENLLLAKCSSSPSKKAACPPWEALVQVRHATLGQPYPSQLAKAKSEYAAHARDSGAVVSPTMHRSQSQQPPSAADAPNAQVVAPKSGSSSTQRTPAASEPAAATAVDIFTDDEEDSQSTGDADESAHVLSEDQRTKPTPTWAIDTTGNHASRPSQASSPRALGHHRRVDSGTFASEIVELSDGEGDIAQSYREARAEAVISLEPTSSKDKDLTSLIYRAGDDTADSDACRQSSRLQSVPVAAADSEDDRRELLSSDGDDADSDERVESTIADVTVDGKSRTVAKVLHFAFKRGMLFKDFPSDTPLRNLIALTLSNNAVSSLALLKEVLDLSRNKLAGIADDELLGFPNLQILDLAHNRLRSIQGLGQVFELKALNVSHNAVKSAKNIEHLVQLQVLNAASNVIANSAALRLLSLNKMITHLDLDGNPVVETDERQRRKNIVYILNLMPMLLSLGSIPCASLSSKEKKSKSGSHATAATPHGRALFDAGGHFPGFQELWTTHVCTLVHCYQDVEASSKSRGGDGDGDDDQWGADGGGDWDSANPSARQPKKLLNGKQQRQKDEQRSRAVGYRSREKAMPSPPKVKTSAYSFGPPLPPPSPKKLAVKKAPPADPRVVKQQQRRASELSAPKYQPVDTNLLTQEQKRKSRLTFDVNMSVAERLLLAQERAQRRGSSSVGGSKRPSATVGGAKQAVAGEKNRDAKRQSQLNTESAAAASAISRSPETSNQEVVVAFRIEPLPRSGASPSRSSVKKPNQVDVVYVQPETTEKPTASPQQPGPVKPGKESSFLQALAVTDFLNHADEEFSTALTALNVLLAMCERETADAKKLAEYRSSLEALDILDERESHELFAKIRDYADLSRRAECAEAFERLGAVKRSMRQLLQRLEADTPGSDAIRAFCRTAPPLESMGVDEEATRSLCVDSSLPAYSPTAIDYVVADITVDIQRDWRDEDAAAALDEAEQRESSATFATSDVNALSVANTRRLEDPAAHESADDDWLGAETNALDAAADADDDDAWLTADAPDSEGDHDSVAAASVDHGDLMPEHEDERDEALVTELEAGAAADATEAQGDSEQLAAPMGAEECDEQQVGDDFENQELDSAPPDAVELAETAVAPPDSERPLSDGEDADDEEAEVFGDWEKGFDPSTNHYFWFNHENGESSWTPPEGWPFEVDTPFEASDEAPEEEGEREDDEELAAGDSELNTEDANAEADADDDDEELRGEHSVLESSQRPLDSEFDDDLFSDQDLPSF